MSGFVTRIEQEEEEPYTVIFTTDDRDKYLHIQNECRIMIDHAKSLTNADRIRAMSDEELAGWLATNDTCPSPKSERKCNNRCGECWLEWLKEEVSE